MKHQPDSTEESTQNTTSLNNTSTWSHPIPLSEIDRLKNYYRSFRESSLRRVNFPVRLAQLLDSEASPIDIFLIARAETTRLQKLMYPGLYDFLNSPHGKAWKYLQKHGMLHGIAGRANFDAVAQHRNPVGMAHALFFIGKIKIYIHGCAGLLDENNEAAERNRYIIADFIDHHIWELEYEEKFETILSLPRHSDLLIQKRTHYSPYTSNVVLADDGIENLICVAKSESPIFATSTALKTMKQGSLLAYDVAQRNRKALSSMHSFCLSLVSGECGNDKYLITRKLMTGEKAQANFDAIVTHPNQKSLGTAFIYLAQARFYYGDITQDDFDILIKNPDPGEAASALYDSDLLGCLTPSKLKHLYFHTIMHHPQPELLANFLRKFKFSNLIEGSLAKKNIQAIARHSAILFESEKALLCWRKMSFEFSTQDCFDAIIRLCEQYEDNPNAGINAFISFVDRTLRKALDMDAKLVVIEAKVKRIQAAINSTGDVQNIPLPPMENTIPAAVSTTSPRRWCDMFVSSSTTTNAPGNTHEYSTSDPTKNKMTK